MDTEKKEILKERVDPRGKGALRGRGTLRYVGTVRGRGYPRKTWTMRERLNTEEKEEH